ncbi:hypothetical protein [Nonomuraea sp. KM90]|uniref:hypothetical protein n=1 Tax=Nonomuraea sp. KM90 TaxID=3457428 RepID=UPI003FCEC35E
MSTDLPHATDNGHAPLELAERVFRLLSNAPAGLSLDGRTFSAELPQRQISLTELRDLLASPTVPIATRDAVWRELVTRARWEGPQWRIGTIGMALPTLRRICGRLCLYWVAGNPAFVEATVLSAFIAAVRDINIDLPDILPRICTTARCAGEQARQKAETDVAGSIQRHARVGASPVWPDPVLVLAEAVGMDTADALIDQLGPLSDGIVPVQETAKSPRRQCESILADAVLTREVEPTRSPAIASFLRSRTKDTPKASARGRITSDPKPIIIQSKGGRGSPTGPARIHILLRRCRQHRFLCGLLVGAVVAFLLAVAVTAAFAESATTGYAAPPKDLNAVFDNLRNWLIGLLATLATLMLTIGGLRYLVAGGDPGEVQKAKAALKAAAFGYGLAVLAPLFVSVLKSIVGGG